MQVSTEPSLGRCWMELHIDNVSCCGIWTRILEYVSLAHCAGPQWPHLVSAEQLAAGQLDSESGERS